MSDKSGQPSTTDLMLLARLALESMSLVLIETEPGPGLAGVVVEVRAGDIGLGGEIGVTLTLLDPEYGATCRISSPYITNITRLGVPPEQISSVDSIYRMPVVQSPVRPGPWPGLRTWQAVHPVYPPLYQETSMSTSADQNPLAATSIMVSVSNLAEALIAASTALQQARAAHPVPPAVDIRTVSRLLLALGDDRGLAPLETVERALDTLLIAGSEVCDAAIALAGGEAPRTRALAQIAVISLAKSLLSAVDTAVDAAAHPRSTLPTAVSRAGLLQVLYEMVISLDGTYSTSGVITDSRAYLCQSLAQHLRSAVQDLEPIPDSVPAMLRHDDLEAALEESMDWAQSYVSAGPLPDELVDETGNILATINSVFSVLSLPCPALESPEERHAILLDSLQGLTLPEIARAIADRPLDDRLSIMAALYARAEGTTGAESRGMDP